MCILQHLLSIQSQLFIYCAAMDCGTVEYLDDEERYIKMSMKIDPSDPTVLSRNGDKALKFINNLIF